MDGLLADSSSALEQLKSLAVAYVPGFLLALLTLVVGWWLIGGFRKLLRRSLESRNVDSTLTPFLVSIVSVLLKIGLLISVISMIGVEMTSFVAIVGALGLAIGLAWQGSLANFAGGVLILFFRPFKVGDFVQAQGHMGTVFEIQILHTVLRTPDNKRIILPNGPLANGDIVNFSAEATRRVDFTFGIGYDDDIDKAREVIKGLVEGDERIHSDPEPQIRVSELADSSVNFVVRVWADAADYWDIYFDMQEKVKKSFDAQGIGIPFPQSDVHIHHHGEAK